MSSLWDSLRRQSPTAPAITGFAPAARRHLRRGFRMSISGRRPGQTVRPDAPWRSQKLFYLAVLAVSGVAVYRWGLATVQPSPATASYTSTATIHLREGLPAAAEPEKTRQQITSRENVYRAVRQLGLATQPPPDEDPQATATRVVEEVGRDLWVTADTTSPPGELAVSVIYTNPSAQYSAQLANTLAGCYADDCRAEWKRQTQRAYAAAREATDRAQQEFLQAKAGLEEFAQQHLSSPQPGQSANPIDANQQQAGNGSPGPTEPRQSDPQTPAAATPSDQPSVGAPSPGESPEWIELSQRLAVLKRRRAELLTDRTPLHPEVQETDLQIAALERQLAAIPREVSAKSPDQPAAADESSDEQGSVPPAGDEARATGVTPVPPAGNRAETARTFQTLKQAADQTTAAYLKAFQQERGAWQEHQREPRIDLDLARPSPPRVPTAPPRLALLLAALAAGLTVAAGVVMISAGAAVQFPLTTVEQARNALPVPVVGIIPETHPTRQPTSVPRRPGIIRWILIAGGLVVISACVGMLLWAWGG
jgi:uncharacterized protein involved in exopolysaccharide biosynthesis